MKSLEDGVCNGPIAGPLQAISRVRPTISQDPKFGPLLGFLNVKVGF